MDTPSFHETPRSSEPPPAASLCPQCGYDVRRLTAPICPECGGPIDADSIQALNTAWCAEQTGRMKIASLLMALPCAASVLVMLGGRLGLVWGPTLAELAFPVLFVSAIVGRWPRLRPAAWTLSGTLGTLALTMTAASARILLLAITLLLAAGFVHRMREGRARDRLCSVDPDSLESLEFAYRSMLFVMCLSLVIALAVAATGR